MNMVGHDHCGMQAELAAVLFQTALDHNIAGSRGKFPSVFGCEGYEKRMIVFLKMGKTAAVIIFRLHTASALRAVTGSETRSYTFNPTS